MSDHLQRIAGSGYWTPHRMDIWVSLTPEQRDFDRFQGWYPPGQFACETAGGRLAIEQRDDDFDYEMHACTCHISPPCSHCTECTNCTEEGS